MRDILLDFSVLFSALAHLSSFTILASFHRCFPFLLFLPLIIWSCLLCLISLLCSFLIKVLNFVFLLPIFIYFVFYSLMINPIFLASPSRFLPILFRSTCLIFSFIFNFELILSVYFFVSFLPIALCAVAIICSLFLFISAAFPLYYP